MKHSTVLIVLTFVVGSFLAGTLYSDVQHEMESLDQPETIQNVTCVTDFENETVHCPELIYGPEWGVRIEVVENGSVAYP